MILILLYLLYIALNLVLTVIYVSRKPRNPDPLRWIVLMLASFLGSLLGIFLSALLPPDIMSPWIHVLDFACSLAGSQALVLLVNRIGSSSQEN